MVMTIIERLAEPFPESRVHWRIGARTKDKSRGIPLAYVDARDVMRRLDDVVGSENWQCRYPMSDGKLLICELGIRCGEEWIWKANGAGDSDVEAEKGKASDAFKRAAVLWGVGRYLYALPNVWVPLTGKFHNEFTPPALPAWATPAGYAAILEKKNSVVLTEE